MSFVLSDAILGLSVTKFLLHLLNFAILFACLWLILYKPVMKFIRARQERVESEQKKAAEDMKAAEEARLASEERLRAIDEEIREKRKAADLELESNCEKRVKEAEQRAQEIIAHAESEAASRADQMLADAKSDLKDVAVTLAESIIEDRIDKVDDALIDSALKDWKNG